MGVDSFGENVKDERIFLKEITLLLTVYSCADEYCTSLVVDGFYGIFSILLTWNTFTPRFLLEQFIRIKNRFDWKSQPREMFSRQFLPAEQTLNLLNLQAVQQRALETSVFSSCFLFLNLNCQVEWLSFNDECCLFYCLRSFDIVNDTKSWGVPVCLSVRLGY